MGGEWSFRPSPRRDGYTKSLCTDPVPGRGNRGSMCPWVQWTRSLAGSLFKGAWRRGLFTDDPALVGPLNGAPWNPASHRPVLRP